MPSLQLVNVWTDSEPGPGGFNPMASSFLWLPDGHRIGDPTPAFLFLHRWGGYPYDSLARELGPALAERGFVVLSLCLSRRGMEGQLNALPENDVRDTKLGIDFLQTQGCRGIFAIGEQLGGLGCLRYQAHTGDRRVSGVACINPVDDPPDWLRQSAGEAAYNEALGTAGMALRQGAGMDTRIDVLAEAGPRVTQNAGAFMSWWGAAADFQLSRNVADVRVPLLVLHDDDCRLPSALGDAGQAVENCSVERAMRGNFAAHLAAWAGQPCVPTVAVEMVTVASNNRELFGLFWPSTLR